MKYFLVLMYALYFAACNGQAIDTVNNQIISVDKKDFLNLRFNSNTYTCNISPFNNGENPNFLKERESKIRTFLINPKTNEKVDLESQAEESKLEIVFSSIALNKNAMTAEFSGFVSGGWYGAGSQVHVYVGEKIDTVTYIHLSPSLEAIVYYNGKKLTKSIVVDTIPSFRMKNYIHAITEVGYDDHKRRAFKITAPIKVNSVLCFGLSSSYVELYDLGKVFIRYKYSSER